MRRNNENIKTPESLPTMRTAALSVILTTLLCVAFTFMFTSTYELEVNAVVLVVGILLLSIASTAFLSINVSKWSGPVLLIGTPFLLGLMLFINFGESFDGLNHVMWTLKAYSFRDIPLSFEKDPHPEDILTVFLLQLDLLPIVFTTWTIIRRRSILWCLPFYIPLFVCSVALDYMFPSQIWCVMAIGGVILLCIFQNLRRGERAGAETKMLLLILPVIIGASFVGMLSPQDEYEKDNVALNQVEKIRSLVYRSAEKAADNIPPDTQKAISDLSNTYMGSVVVDNLVSSIATMNPGLENLDRVGNFDPPHFAVMNVTRNLNPNGGTNGGSYLYLKTSSMDTYTGHAFRSSDSEPSRMFKEDLNQQEAQYILHVNSEVHSDVFFVPYYIDGYVVSSDYADRVLTTQVLNTRMSTVTSEPYYDFALSDLPVRRDASVWDEDYLEYVQTACLDVPDETLEGLLNSGRLPDWYMSLYRGETTMSDIDKVLAVTDFVSKLCEYDEHTDFQPRTEDFVVWFVKNGESGFCVHYACTAVILLRMIGVPARYVNGYMVDSLEDGRRKEVYSEDAHAWFEFFIPEYGWILGDATPGNAFAASDFDASAIAKKMNYEPEEIPGHTITDDLGTRTVTSPVTTTTKTPQDQTSTPSPTPSEKEASANTDPKEQEKTKKNEKKSSSVPGKVWALLGICLFLAVLRLLYNALWRRSWNQKNINDSARAYYRYFSMMSRKWKGRPASRASFIAQKAAFSSEGISDQELEKLVESGKSGLASLQKKQPWYRRLPVKLLFEVKV
ncbi:MAG: transglutaminase domain-containing protein [Clostridiales bacterium]|nr:transglutaminase domain-containing protein [Clostridiales bacterium]